MERMLGGAIKPMKIVLTRHGQSLWNIGETNEKYCGGGDKSFDVPLTELGIIQAHKVGKTIAKKFNITKIFSSPLKRAKESAKIINKYINCELKFLDNLREISYGFWEGLTREEIIKLYPDNYREWVNDPANTAPYEGETGYQVRDRIVLFFNSLMKEIKDNENILIVGHKTVNRIIICHILGIDIKDYRDKIKQDNASLSIFEKKEKSFILSLLNDTCHLIGE